MTKQTTWILVGALCLAGCRAVPAGSRVPPTMGPGLASERALINLDGGTLINLDSGTLQASSASTRTCLARSVVAEEPSEATPGGMLTLAVSASRPGLRYAWSTSQGAVGGAGGASATWTVPEAVGSYFVEVVVTDAEGSTAALRWTVAVTEAGATVTPPAPGTCP